MLEDDKFVGGWIKFQIQTRMEKMRKQLRFLSMALVPYLLRLVGRMRN